MKPVKVWNIRYSDVCVYQKEYVTKAQPSKVTLREEAGSVLLLQLYCPVDTARSASSINLLASAWSHFKALNHQIWN